MPSDPTRASIDRQKTPTFSPLIRNKLDQTIQGERTKPLVGQRPFSMVSAASKESIQNAKSTKADSDDGDNEFRRVIFDAGTNVIDAELRRCRGVDQGFDSQYNKGALDIANATKDKEIAAPEKRTRDLRSKLVRAAMPVVLICWRGS